MPSLVDSTSTTGAEHLAQGGATQAFRKAWESIGSEREIAASFSNIAGCTDLCRVHLKLIRGNKPRRCERERVRVEIGRPGTPILTSNFSLMISLRLGGQTPTVLRCEWECERLLAGHWCIGSS